MILMTACFNREEGYGRLKKVFLNSARACMHKIEIIVKDIIPPVHNYGDDMFNNHHWDTFYSFMAKIRYAIACNENICLSDSDIMFLKSVTDVFDNSFDIAICIREHSRKFNTGIFFCKPTDNAKRFLNEWMTNTAFVAKEFNLKEIDRWSGIDQAALVRTLEKNKSAKIVYLPCKIWNAEQTCWKFVTDETRVIHIKSGLRDILFGRKQMLKKHGYLKKILERIKHYENL